MTSPFREPPATPPPSPPPLVLEGAHDVSPGCAIFCTTVLGVLMFVGSIISLSSSSSYHSNRFHSDNAMGATANAVERLADRGAQSSFDWLVAGLILIVIGQLINLNSKLSVLLVSKGLK